MTDDLQRRFSQARDAAHRAADEVAAMLPGADVIRRRAARRRAVRRGAAVVSCLAVGITAITMSAGGNEGRSTVLASKPPSSSPEPTLTTEASTTTSVTDASTTSVTAPVTTTATKSRPTTTTTPKPVSDACQASRIPSEALGFTRLDDRRLIVTGSGGGVAMSADNGDTWSPACIPGSISEASLRDVSFLPDGQNGWIVGNLGDSPGTLVVVRTKDGGEHWETGSVRAPAGSLQAVTFTDPLHGWAVGSKGESNDAMILRSVDGGRTWTEGKLDAGSKRRALLDVTFFDAQHGWAVGWGIVVRTSDGGATWTSQELQFGIYGTFFTRVVFVDNDHGWIVGTYGVRHDSWYGIILETRDGGRTWSRQPSAPPGGFGGLGLHSMQALSEQVLVLVGEQGRMWRSSDGGHQWEAVAALTVAGSSEAFDPYTRPYLGHVVFTDAEHGWVTIRPRGGALPGQLCVTNDGGRTWEGRSLSGQRFACKNTL